MKGMILAAGFGTRFRPVTYEIPKPLITLCNRPLIDYAVEAMLAAGIRHIIVNLHHLPEKLEEHLTAGFSGRCELYFSREKEILGTGGAIRRVRNQLQSEPSFLLANADTVQFPPFRELEEQRRGSDAVASLLLRHPPAHDKFTRVFLQGSFVRGIGEGDGEALMFAGAHSISSEIFDLLPDRDFSGITEDVYIPILRESRLRISAVIHDGPWFDIGTPLRYLEASRDLLGLIAAGTVAAPSGSLVVAESASLVAENAIVESNLSRSVVGTGAVLYPGTRLEESVAWEDSIIGSHAELRQCIVARDVAIPPGTVATNALFCNYRKDADYDESAVQFGGLIALPIDPEKGLVLDIR